MESIPLLLVRHGESLWNSENRFTGWVDVDLSEKGQIEARQAGRELKKLGLQFDQAYTSVLRRAIRTLWLALEEMDAMYLPVLPSWRLNERHYGALQGLNKTETAQKYGEEKVKIWRRSYDTPPPLLSDLDWQKERENPKYRSLRAEDFPRGETLKSTMSRFLPLWHETISPRIKKGEKVLIVAHGNSLRALIQHLEGFGPEEIMEVNVPTGVPLLYELSPDLKVKAKRYLGDPEEIARKTAAVASQGKK